MRTQMFRDGDMWFDIENPSKISEAAQLARQLDAKIPEPARSGWRWRILYLRALIDEQIAVHNGHITEDCEPLLAQLSQIYHIVPESHAVICPPSLSVIKQKWLKKDFI